MSRPVVRSVIEQFLKLSRVCAHFVGGQDRLAGLRCSGGGCLVVTGGQIRSSVLAACLQRSAVMASAEHQIPACPRGLLAWPDGPAMRVRVTLLGVPAQFAADTLAREGEAARAWLARLPELVGELCARWGLRVTGDPMHGYMALVVPVLRGDARYALKVSWIDDETLNEAAALALWNGGGAVRLLDADDAAERCCSSGSIRDAASRRRTCASRCRSPGDCCGGWPYRCRGNGPHARSPGSGSGHWTWPRNCRDCGRLPAAVPPAPPGRGGRSSHRACPPCRRTARQPGHALPERAGRRA